MGADGSEIRKPAVAGLFYPADVGELTRTIAGMFAEVKKAPVTGHPAALIVPHAGYPYSGKVAAKAYKHLEGQEYDTVVIISPSHTVFFKGASIYDGDGYRTPLGVVPIDKEISARMGDINPNIQLSRKGHATGATRGEHALEVQLPFLQVVLGNFKLVAVVMGDQEEDTMRSLGETLAAVLKGTNSLLIASTDLSHFHPEKTARRLDNKVRQAIEKYDPTTLIETLESGDGEACGGGTVAAVMLACKRLGAKQLTFLDYATSGESTGDFESVVGYLSAIITGEKKASVAEGLIGSRPATKEELDRLTDDDRRILHDIARQSILAGMAGKEFEPPVNERLEKRRGVFVTINLDNELRGCIGLIKARGPLNEAVAEMARAAAFEDPRFSPLTNEELERIDIEISVLSPLTRVHRFNEVKVGRDGLMVKLDMHSGLLLPQVAIEYGWDNIEFLEQTCLKAGLPKHSYKDKYIEIYRFTADVF